MEDYTKKILDFVYFRAHNSVEVGNRVRGSTGVQLMLHPWIPSILPYFDSVFVGL